MVKFLRINSLYSVSMISPKLFTRVFASYVLVSAVFPSATDAALNLTHRYSFESGGSDLVGDADATFHNGATVSSGQVVLDGVDDYVSLPIGSTIESLSSYTIEAWFNLDSLDDWSRIYDFGNTETTGYMFLTPQNGVDANPRATITTTGNTADDLVDSTTTLTVGAEYHIALTYDSVDDLATIYINGVSSGSDQVIISPSALGNTQNNYLGRSLYNVDPYLDGSINEFRIYSEALSSDDVSLSYSLGADSVIPEPSSTLISLTALACLASRRFRKAD